MKKFLVLFMALAFIMGCSNDGGGTTLNWPAEFLGDWVPDSNQGTPKVSKLEFSNSGSGFVEVTTTTIQTNFTLELIYVHSDGLTYTVKSLDETGEPETDCEISIEADGRMKIDYLGIDNNNSLVGGLKYVKQ
jgi:hypothetical protein